MLKLYPRGFVGAVQDAGTLSSSNNLSITAASNTFRLDVNRKQDDVFDITVLKLYRRFSTNSNFIKDFNFREEILRKAKEVFSFNKTTFSFQEFVKAQITLGKIGVNHLEYLREVLTYINTGRIGLAFSDWVSIISLTDKDNASYLGDIRKKELSGALDDYLAEPCFSTLASTIQQWVTHEDGFVHLLLTMYFFYGAPIDDSSLGV